MPNFLFFYTNSIVIIFKYSNNRKLFKTLIVDIITYKYYANLSNLENKYFKVEKVKKICHSIF